MAFTRRSNTETLAGADTTELDKVRDQAHQAKLANRPVFVARLPLPADQPEGVTDVGLWSHALHQIGMHGYQLGHWSVVPEAGGTVAYAVFARA